MRKLTAVAMLVAGLVLSGASAGAAPARPTLELSPGVVTKGDPVRVVSSGWTPGALVSFFFADDQANPLVETAGSNGQVVLNLAIPAPVIPGSTVLMAAGPSPVSLRNLVVTPLRVSPATSGIELSAASVAPGGTLTATSRGWTPGATITYSAKAGALELAVATADAHGASTATFALPPTLDPGDHMVLARGESGPHAESIFGAQFQVEHSDRWGLAIAGALALGLAGLPLGALWATRRGLSRQPA